MSVLTLDYIPFDYQRYFREILPAFERAFQGNSSSLKALLTSPAHIALSLRTRYPIPLTGDEGQHFLRCHTEVAGLLDVPTLRRIKAGDAWNPWEAFVAVLPTLEGKTAQTSGKYGELLQSLLLATLCCELPPWSANWPAQSRCAVVWHDEVVSNWGEYTARDEETQALWSTFYQPLPPEMVRQRPGQEDEPISVWAEHRPRAIFCFLDDDISGFITCEETERLLGQVRIRERPELASIIQGCIRDGEGKEWTVEIEMLLPGVVKHQEERAENEYYYRVPGGKYIGYKDLFMYWKQVHPHEMEDFLQGYYRHLWLIEQEVLYRMRFATARRWGMLTAHGG